MIYWRDLRLASADLRQAKLDRRTAQLVRVFRQAGAAPISSPAAATDALAAKLRDGSRSLAELGAHCDQLFTFT